LSTWLPIAEPLQYGDRAARPCPRDHYRPGKVRLCPSKADVRPPSFSCFSSLPCPSSPRAAEEERQLRGPIPSGTRSSPDCGYFSRPSWAHRIRQDLGRPDTSPLFAAPPAWTRTEAACSLKCLEPRRHAAGAASCRLASLGGRDAPCSTRLGERAHRAYIESPGSRLQADCGRSAVPADDACDPEASREVNRGEG
jgi:hypothetical protein